MNRTLILRRMVLSGMSFILLSMGCKSVTTLESEQEIVELAAINSVAALGRLEPEGSLINVSVSNAQDSRVNQLFVEEGDLVENGQVIALLQGVERRMADVQSAEAELRLREAELRKVLKGDAKQAQIKAQEFKIDELQAQIEAERIQREAAIRSSEATFREAKLRLELLLELQSKGGLTALEVNQAELDVETATATLIERQAALQQTVTTLEALISQAQADLLALKEIRPLDVEIAQANLDKARIEIEQRQADLEDVRVRAPASGQILRINTHVGEQVNTSQGIVELAQTQQMYAIAEVYESDIVRVNLGQSAKIISNHGAFEGELQGVVENIGLQIGRRTVKSEAESGPNQDQDTRIVEVRIRIDPVDSVKVSNFTNMLVQISIDTVSQSRREDTL
ncbi:MAG: HlyD family efflux transporter periplasmic adaptor subunit [Cyanobacteria bacterium P01_H01_bin.21]